MSRECVICGVSIEGRHILALTCSTECSGERRKRACAAWKKQKSAKRLANAAPKRCLRCDGVISERGRAAKFCSANCRDRHARDMVKRERLERKISLERECSECGGDISPERAGGIYCCGRCRYIAGKRREREKIACYRAMYPMRYRGHRDKENRKRAEARAALKIINEIKEKGMEALL